ncbi:MAG TPA: hypothetical protein VJ746_09340 [Nitrospira sp.]|nr:hypothetical protein [Nitrospira sp.]
MASFAPNPELEERRLLLQAAARGCVSAQLKLNEEYHVRVYSASERKQYAVERTSVSKPASVRRR